VRRSRQALRTPLRRVQRLRNLLDVRRPGLRLARTAGRSARRVIDLHCHILPGLDDGPPDLDASVALARLAAADGTRTIVATPHVREDYPFKVEQIATLTGQVNERLAAENVPITVKAGAEVAISRLSQLDDDTLGKLCLGDDTNAMLVESPYQQATD